MDTDEFAAEVHKRLCAVPEDEALKDPHATLMQIARNVAWHHPVAWAQIFWKGRQMRRELRAKQEKKDV